MTPNSANNKKAHPLIKLASSSSVKQVSGFAYVAAGLSIDQLCQWYGSEKDAAPGRAAKGGKPYFVDHSGVTEKEHFAGETGGKNEGRKEEHLAIALFNDYGPSTEGLVTDQNDAISILDYQLPLKAASSDGLIGKVDLLALDAADRLAVVELKYMPVEGSVSSADTPLRAFLEGLAYCALLEADIEGLHQQAVEKFARPIVNNPPSLVVLANNMYWEMYLNSKVAGTWEIELQRLAMGVENNLGIPVSFLSLSLPDDPVKYQDRRPKFIQRPILERAW